MSTKSLVLILSSAAFAASATPASAAKPASQTQASKPDDQVYCVKFEPLTGSHLRKTECKTKKAWMREGVDIEKETDRSAD